MNEPNVIYDMQYFRLQRDIDELRAQLAELANTVHKMVFSLQSQLDGKVNSEAKFQP